jgi:hypothetical protein
LLIIQNKMVSMAPREQIRSRRPDDLEMLVMSAIRSKPAGMTIGEIVEHTKDEGLPLGRAPVKDITDNLRRESLVTNGPRIKITPEGAEVYDSEVGRQEAKSSRLKPIS